MADHRVPTHRPRGGDDRRLRDGKAPRDRPDHQQLTSVQVFAASTETEYPVARDVGVLKDGARPSMGTATLQNGHDGVWQYGQRLRLGGDVPTHQVGGLDHLCRPEARPGASVVIEERGADGSWTTLDAASTGGTRWTASVWAPRGGQVTVRARTSLPDGTSAVVGRPTWTFDVTPEPTALDVRAFVRGRLLETGRLVVPRGTPLDLDLALRSIHGTVRPRSTVERPVELALRPLGAEGVVRFDPVVLRGLDEPVGRRLVVDRSGEYDLRWAGSEEQGPSSAVVRVRLQPRVTGWPSTSVRTRSRSTLLRTLKVTDHDGARVWVEVWYPETRAWGEVGRDRAVDSRGRVKVRVPRLSGTRKFRVVVGDLERYPDGGFSMSPLVATKSWTVTRR